MLMDLLNKAVTVAMLGFVVSSMLAMGSGLTIRQIIEPLRNARLVLLALLANFVLMPLGALRRGEGALARRIRLELDCCCSGAPPARRFCRSSLSLPRATSRFPLARWCCLMVVTVGYLPVVLPLLLPGVTVDPWKIARSLVLLMLLPLAAGLALKARYEELGQSSEAHARLDFQHQPHPAGIVDHRSEHRQGSTSLRHTRNSCRASLYRIGLWDWLVARRS